MSDRRRSRRRRGRSSDDAPTPLVAPGEGPRARARREQRRRRTRTFLGGLLVVALGVVAAPFVIDVVADLADDAPDTAGEDADLSPVDVEAATSSRLLVAIDDPSAAADQVVLALLDVDAAGSGTVLLIPDRLTADVPGLGLVPLASAHRFGDVDLVALTLTSVLDLEVTAATTLERADLAAIATRIGGVEVDVPTTVLDADGDVAFEPGPQTLTGARTAELLTIRQPDEPALQSLPRVGAVLTALAEALDATALDAVFGDGAPMVERETVGDLEQVLTGLAAAAADGRLDVRTLPVTAFDGGEELPLYRLDAPAARALVVERFGADPVLADDDRLRLEIRNGNGLPGIGADVAQLLVPLGHRVVLTGNAERFDVATTQIVANDPDDDVVAAAQEILETLGVGRVVIGDGTRSVADVTIVVGRDFGG